jgi:hypothetical protein
VEKNHPFWTILPPPTPSILTDFSMSLDSFTELLSWGRGILINIPLPQERSSVKESRDIEKSVRIEGVGGGRIVQNGWFFSTDITNN